MAQDLLSTIRAEISERMDVLRPLLAEHERLLVAAQALQGAHAEEVQAEGVHAEGARPEVAHADAPANTGAKAPRGGRPKRATVARGVSETGIADTLKPQAAELAPEKAPRVASTRRAPAKAGAKPVRAARGAAREAILAALEHGSHTVGELSVVTAMTGPNINGNLRRLVAEGVVAKTEREGKIAWSLVEPAI